MQDPFGNEFCVINVLTPEQADAVAQAGENGPATTTTGGSWPESPRRNHAHLQILGLESSPTARSN